MTGYLFLLSTVILNTAKGFCSKKLSGDMDHLNDNIDLSMLRNTVCALIGGILIAVSGSFGISSKGLLICGISGINATANYIVWVMALKSDAYMLVSAVNSASFVIPAALSIIFFDETPTVYDGIIVIILVAAIACLLKYQNKLKGTVTKKGIPLLIILFITAGMDSFTQKWFVNSQKDISLNTFSFYTFAFSLGLLLIMRLILGYPASAKTEVTKFKSLLPFIVFMGAALYGATFFKTGAAKLVDALILYPMLDALSLVAGCLMSWIFFKEKPNRWSVAGMILIFTALVLKRL